LAISERRIGTPSFTPMMSLANSSALCSESVAVTAIVVWPSLRKPCGEVTLAAVRALRSWSGERPMAFNARRFTSTRMAGVALPAMSTVAMPSCWRRRWARTESATL
jgi:hypothetical protein